jgi:hypothetical protein
MSQTYRIGSLNFTGSQAVLSASLDVSGSGRFTDGLTVTGSLSALGSGSIKNGTFTVDAGGNGKTVTIGGDASNSSISFIGDDAGTIASTNNIILNPTNDIIISNLWRLKSFPTIDAYGAVGIQGATNKALYFENGSGDPLVGGFIFDYSGTGGGLAGNGIFNVKYQNTSSLFINTSGSVGIKNTNPVATLDISGSGRFTDGLTVTGSLTATGEGTFGGDNGVYLTGPNSGVWLNTSRTVGMGGGNSGNIVFRTNNIDNRLVITSGGRIGVSTLTPSHSLDVNGDGRFTDGLIVTRSLYVTGSEPTIFSATGDVLEVSGSFVLYGSASISDSVVIEGPVNIKNSTRITGSLEISGSIIPAVDGVSTTSSFSLGSATNAWKDIWVSNGTINFLDGAGNVQAALTSNDQGLQIENYAATTGSVPVFNISGSGNITNGLTITGSLAQGDSVIATGSYSHAEGRLSIASGSYSHAEGNNTQAIGDNSHAEGFQTQAIGNGSHAEGYQSIASGSWSHAEGGYQDEEVNIFPGGISIGLGSHAEGYLTQAIGSVSHAEGEETQAKGKASHAEGFETIASGSWSHAEGDRTTAFGDYSHAEGRETQAIGDYSHAEGDVTQALGDYSFTHGVSTIASSSYQFVVGKHNEHNNTTSLFVVGTGVANETRKDGFSVDTDEEGLTTIRVPSNTFTPASPKTGSMYVDPANNKLWIYTGNGGVGGWVTSSLG